MIELLRAAAQASDCCAGRSAMQRPVEAWSVRRLLDLLGHKGRRALHLAEPGCATLTAQERALAQVFAALEAGDREAALRHAQWLVPTAEAARLVRWAEPVACREGQTRIAA